MSIEWVFPNATPEQKQRALDAALQEFKTYHIDPAVAAVAQLEWETYVRRGKYGPLPHKDSERGSLVFERARVAATLAALEAGAPMEAQKQGYIRVDIDPASRAGYFMRESRVLNWIDPDGQPTASN